MHTNENSAEVIIKLAPGALPANSPGHRALQSCAAGIGVSIQPLHPSTSDPELSTYFVAHVDRAALSSLIDQLRRCEGVVGAYAKERGEAP